MAKAEAGTGVTSPPSGTGNAPGLGESFNINLNTGQGMYSYTLPLPDGVAGHTPKIRLEYSHGAGLGVFGLGWRWPVRSISRRLDLGVPDVSAAERFMDSGAEILPLADGTFGPLTEAGFTRYRRKNDGWLIEERNGAVHEMGLTAAGRISEPGHPERVHEWLLERTTDTSGNAITYSYLLDGGTFYLSEIRYAAYALRLNYEDRPDARSDGRLGFLRRRTKRCSRADLILDPGVGGGRRIRSWSFAYQLSPAGNVSLLSSIAMVSHGLAANGSQNVVRPPVKFEYSLFKKPDPGGIQWMEAPDGSHPPDLTDPDTTLITLDNAPLPGILQVVNGRQYYWRNQGNGSWGAPEPVIPAPALNSFVDDGVAFIDMDASGTADLMQSASSLPGYYENAGRKGWDSFVAFPRGRRAAPEWSSGRVRLTDSNGDGRIDAIMSGSRSFAVWLNQGKQGWSEPLLAVKGDSDARPNVDFSDPLVRMADMSGDGIDDIVRIGSGRIEYWPGLGYGRYGDRVVMSNSPRLRDLTRDLTRDPQSVMLMDVDGDGCADLVRISAAGIEIVTNQNGISFAEPDVLDTMPAPIPGTQRPVNMNGRAGSGLLWNTYRGRRIVYVYLDFNPGQPPYLLTKINNGAGLESEINYRSAVEDYTRDRAEGNIWQTNFPFPYMVVAGTKERDTVTGHTCEISYRYHEGHFNSRARQFQGFRRADRIEKGDESRSDTLTVSHFLMAQEALPGNGPEHAALNGMLERTEVFSLDSSALQGRPYHVEMAEHSAKVLEQLPDGRSRTFVFVTAHRVEDRERTDDVRGEEKKYLYDGVGNVTKETVRGYGTLAGAAQPERVRVTDISYAAPAAAAARRVIDKFSRSVTRDGNGVILAEKRCYYDGPAFQGLPLGQAERGLVSREEQLVLPEAAFNTHYAGMNKAALGYTNGSDADGAQAIFAAPKRHSYDARGLKIKDRDALGNDTTFEYSADGLFRTKLVDALGTTLFDYDRAVGQPATVTYQDGTKASYAYDAQGRVLFTTLPGESAASPATTFTYDDASLPNSRTARFRQSNAAGDVSVGVTYFDGRGKETQQRVETDGGRFVVSGWNIRNPWGDVKQEYEPTFSTSAAFAIPAIAGRPHRDISFDGCGRMTKTVNYNGGISTAIYLPFEVITRDANDNDNSPENVARGQFNTPHHETFDVLHNPAAIIEDTGGGVSVITRYRTDALGRLIETIDDHGTMCTYRYDCAGNRLEINHRDAGSRKIWYDAKRKAVRTLDANGNDLRAEIDFRGRLVRLSTAAVTLEEYVYDDPARNALGRLAQVSYPGGKQIFNYDQTGRLTGHEYQFDGAPAPHKMSYEYDLLGREVAVTHPDGTRIAKKLTRNGWVKSIDGFLSGVTYNSRGLPAKIKFANGVVTDTTYTDGPGRVKTQKTANGAALVLEDITYTYDKMEVLLTGKNTAPGDLFERSYAYDPLYQLTQASTSAGGGAVTKRNYEYDHHFNLTRFDETGGTMQYDDPLHPDRVNGLTPQGAPRLNPGYDANGNLLTLPDRTFSYNVKNELKRVQRAGGLTAEYLYDHRGIRVSKIVDDNGNVTRTFFADRFVEIRNGQPTYFVCLGDLRVALLSGGTTRFVHSDYLGSTSFFTDAAGVKIAAVAYRPFGNVDSSSGNVDRRTYGVHPFDAESGLYYMRRRYYAPEIGRFLTPDPIAVYKPTDYQHNPKALHPYIYVANDPLNKSDMTGLSFWSVVGAIVGVIAAIAIVAAVVATGGLAGIVLGIVMAVGITAVSYVVADATQGTGFGEFMRGFMIGMNAGLNAAIATVIFGPGIGLTLGVINFLAAFDTIANNSIYQGILGWSSWLMPMSWLATGIGLINFLITLPSLAGNASVSIDWGTGTIVMSGGWTVPSGVLGYDMGNFAFIPAGGVETPHETGHTLNNAAFGSIFHFIGAIDENVLRTSADSINAYSEKLAESHAPRDSDPILPMWGV
jgi:RHS repeat-associated protein